MILPEIFHVRNGDGRVADAVVDDRIDSDGHRIARQDFLRRHVEGYGTQVDLGESVDARDDEEQTGSARAAFDQATQTEYDSSFVFLHNLHDKPIEPDGYDVLRSNGDYLNYPESLLTRRAHTLMQNHIDRGKVAIIIM